MQAVLRRIFYSLEYFMHEAAKNLNFLLQIEDGWNIFLLKIFANEQATAYKRIQFLGNSNLAGRSL